MAPTLKTVLEGKGKLEGKYIPDFADLKTLVKLLKDGGFSVVLTQGVYDMFHVGHGRYLEEAASFGHVLIVGVDSDELTKEMKGPTRPFDRFEDRVEVLSMLSFVNIITKRDVGQHMHDLIKLVKPDVLVMSKTTSSFKEKDKKALERHCGRIEHLDPKAPPESVSTTAKIRRLHAEGVEVMIARIIKAIEETRREYFFEDKANA